jgi:hypothetical protein
MWNLKTKTKDLFPSSLSASLSLTLELVSCLEEGSALSLSRALCAFSVGMFVTISGKSHELINTNKIEKKDACPSPLPLSWSIPMHWMHRISTWSTCNLLGSCSRLLVAALPYLVCAQPGDPSAPLLSYPRCLQVVVPVSTTSLQMLTTSVLNLEHMFHTTWRIKYF